MSVVFFFFKSKKKKVAKQEITVSTISIEMSKISTSLESIGTAISNEATDITSSITQIVESINFSDCEIVKKGQLLVQLNVDKRKAFQKQSEINLMEQEREHNRLLVLKQKKVIPEKDYDIQLTKLQDARAKIDEINAEIKEASILAPFDGILGIRKISVGALVSPGTVISTIDDISKLKVDFTIPEKYILLLNPKSKIIAESSAVSNHKFHGSISAISPRLSTTSRSLSVRATIDNKNYLLRPGMMLKVTVTLESRDAIQIPERSVSSVGERHFVFLVRKVDEISPKFKVYKKYVRIGERQRGFVEIKGGLEKGDCIVLDGIGKLSDNDEVKIVNKATAS